MRHCSSTTSDNNSQKASRTTASHTAPHHTSQHNTTQHRPTDLHVERQQWRLRQARNERILLYVAMLTCMGTEEHDLLSEVGIVDDITEQPGAASWTNAIQLREQHSGDGNEKMIKQADDTTELRLRAMLLICHIAERQLLLVAV